MACSRRARDVWRHLAMTILLWAMTTAKPSKPVAYCASLNTATMNANTSIYQSDGLCYDFCLDDYALAVVQGEECWCTNYVPSESSQVSTDECENPCPGYPSDYCGGDDLYGYMTLALAVSGTAASSSSFLSSTTSSGGSSTTGTGTQPTPTISQITSDGVVKTVTVTPTASSTPLDLSDKSSGAKGLSTGAAVGIAIGVVAVIAFIAVAIIVLFIKRRRRRQAEKQEDFDSPSQRGSSAGIMGGSKNGDVLENRYVGGSDGKTMADSWETAQGRRRSTLMPVDPRMDPFNKGIYRAENKSHETVNSLQDDQDYSRRVHEPARVLRATNPDPDDE